MIVQHNWLADHLNDKNLVIVDARGFIPYSYAHISNSIPLGIEKVIKMTNNGANEVIDVADAEKLFSSIGIDNDKKVIVYGESLDPSVARILWTLLYYGHKDANMLDIGFMAWQKLGLPVTRQSVNPTPAKFNASTGTSMRANAEFITQTNDADLMILDNRSIQEYMRGRIPKAVNFPWTDGIGGKGEIFRSKEELQKLFADNGISKDKQVVCYCSFGMRPSYTFIALKIAGFQNVRLYNGSIIDWASRRLPIEY